MTRSKIYYKTVTAKGRQTSWLTMIHGFSQTHNYFSKQISKFQEDFHLFLADLRGHGQSVKAKGPYGIEEYADDIIAALDDAGIKKTHYWGTHTGAAIGLILALRHPDRFNSLVLEGTFLPGFEMPRVVELLNNARMLAKSDGVQAALENWIDYADWFSYIRNHPQECRFNEHKKIVYKFQGSPWLCNLEPKEVKPVADHLDEIHIPALVYNGKNDLDDFKKAALLMDARLPNVQHEEIADSGGFPGWENPKVVNNLVHSFLEKRLFNSQSEVNNISPKNTRSE